MLVEKVYRYYPARESVFVWWKPYSLKATILIQPWIPDIETGILGREANSPSLRPPSSSFTKREFLLWINDGTEFRISVVSNFAYVSWL